MDFAIMNQAQYFIFISVTFSFISTFGLLWVYGLVKCYPQLKTSFLFLCVHVLLHTIFLSVSLSFFLSMNPALCALHVTTMCFCVRTPLMMSCLRMMISSLLFLITFFSPNPLNGLLLNLLLYHPHPAPIN